MSNAGERIKVVVVEDEDLYRDLLARDLAGSPVFQVMASFKTAAAALAAIPRLQPDVAVVDIALGEETNGIQLGLLLRDKLPQLGIVVLSNYLSRAILRSLPEDARQNWCYLHKKAVSDAGVLEQAVAETARGTVVTDTGADQDAISANPALRGLTERERMVIDLMAEGLSNIGIARRLGLTGKTVENNINRIYHKLAIERHDSRLQPRVRAILALLQMHSHTAKLADE